MTDINKLFKYFTFALNGVFVVVIGGMMLFVYFVLPWFWFERYLGGKWWMHAILWPGLFFFLLWPHRELTRQRHSGMKRRGFRRRPATETAPYINPEDVKLPCDILERIKEKG